MTVLHFLSEQSVQQTEEVSAQRQKLQWSRDNLPTRKPDLYAADNFNDVINANEKVKQQQEPWKNLLVKMDRRKVTRRKKGVTIADLKGHKIQPNATVYERFQWGISDQELYREDDPNIERMMAQMVKSPFESIEQKEGGTQFKLIVDLEDGGQALFKPMRFERERVRKKDVI